MSTTGEDASSKRHEERWHLPGKEVRANPSSRWPLIERDFQKYGFASLGYSGGGTTRPEFETELFHKFLPNCDMSKINISPGGCMVVTRKRLLSNSKAWYTRWFNEFRKSRRHEQSMGWLCELAWPCVFGQPEGDPVDFNKRNASQPTSASSPRQSRSRKAERALRAGATTSKPLDSRLRPERCPR